VSDRPVEAHLAAINSALNAGETAIPPKVMLRADQAIDALVALLEGAEAALSEARAERDEWKRKLYVGWPALAAHCDRAEALLRDTRQAGDELARDIRRILSFEVVEAVAVAAGLETNAHLTAWAAWAALTATGEGGDE
jgi:hypothetical protein